MRVASLGNRIVSLAAATVPDLRALYATLSKRPVRAGGGALCLAGRVYTDGPRHYEHSITSR
jgi:hypothetical protein